MSGTTYRATSSSGTAGPEVREQAEQHVLKVTEGRPNAVDKEIALAIDTTFGKQEIADSFSIRRR